VVPGFVESDGEGPWGMAVVFEDVDRVPAEFVDVGKDFIFRVVGADALGFRDCCRPALLCWMLAVINCWRDGVGRVENSAGMRRL
jgi:hypothetical protein